MTITATTRVFPGRRLCCPSRGSLPRSSMGKKGRRTSRGSGPGPGIGLSPSGDDHEPVHDVLNPRPAIVSVGVRANEEVEEVVTCDHWSDLESAPSKWKAMASAIAQALVLSPPRSGPPLRILSPYGIPCQVFFGSVQQTHLYLPSYYIANQSTRPTLHHISTPPIIALKIIVHPLNHNSNLASMAVRQTVSDLFVVDRQVIMVDVMGETHHYTIRIQDPSPNIDNLDHHPQIFRLSPSTRIIISSSELSSNPSSLSDQDQHYPLPLPSSFPGIGGLSRELQSIYDFASLCLHKYDLLQKMNVSVSCKGLLLYGPPGTGKSLIARHLSSAMGASLHSINGADCLSGTIGKSESILKRLFNKAIVDAPSIIFIDEIDVLCPDPASGNPSSETALHARMGFTLSSLFASLDQRSRVLVVAATNRPNSIDPSLRQPGRFDRETLIGVPNPTDRLEILKIIVKSLGDHAITDGGLAYVAESSHGFVGADLHALVKQAALFCLHRGEPVLVCGDEHLRQALNVIGPSALRDTVVEVPKVLWDHIGGQEQAKSTLKEVVEWPLRYPDAFARLGIQPPRGVLLYGPPGCSKTMMARALATESSLNFIAVKGPELLSKWVGDSEKAVRDIFVKARGSAPTIVFFDEIDSIASTRQGMQSGVGGGSAVGDRVLSQLLSELDGIEVHGSVIVVAATNRPGSLDPALLRPGRIDRMCYVSLPDASARRQILKIHLAKYKTSETIDAEEAVRRTDGFSGAEIGAICREAALKAMEEYGLHDGDGIRRAHMNAALAEAKPRISPESVEYYERFAAKSIRK